MRWIELANVEKDFEGLKNLVVREQYLLSSVGSIFKRMKATGSR